LPPAGQAAAGDTQGGPDQPLEQPQPVQVQRVDRLEFPEALLDAGGRVSACVVCVCMVACVCVCVCLHLPVWWKDVAGGG